MAGERPSQIDPILLAAAELFEQQGYDRTSVVEIAARAGFARSTVFARYASKQALLVGIVRAFHEALRNLPGGPSFRGAAERPVPARPSRRARGGNGSSARSSAPSELERAVRRVHELCQRLGALARVACAARELPWIRGAVEDDVAAVAEMLRGWFGDAGRDEFAHDLLWNVVRRGCIAPTGRGPSDVGSATRLVVLLRSWEPVPRGRPGRASVTERG